MLGRKVVFSARIQATGQESCSTLPSKSIPHKEKEKLFWWHILNSLELRILCTILVKYTPEMTSKCSNLKWNSRMFLRKLLAVTEKNKLRYHFVLFMASTFIDHSSRPISASELTQLLKKAICFFRYY